MLVSIRCQHRRSIIIRINTNGINLYQVFIAESILYTFHLIGHNRADTWATGKDKIHNGDFPLHFHTPYPATVLGYKGKVGDIMLLPRWIITDSKRVFHPLLKENGNIISIFTKVSEK